MNEQDFNTVLKELEDFLNKDASSMQELADLIDTNNRLIYIKNDYLNYE